MKADKTYLLFGKITQTPGSLVTPLPYIPLMSTKRRRRSIKLLVCPSCQQIGVLRKIVYGMPDPENFDFEKFAVGGCCGSPDGIDPDVRCRQCEWEGFRDSLE
jgi:hypothetical protein